MSGRPSRARRLGPSFAPWDTIFVFFPAVFEQFYLYEVPSLNSWNYYAQPSVVRVDHKQMLRTNRKERCT